MDSSIDEFSTETYVRRWSVVGAGLLRYDLGRYIIIPEASHNYLSDSWPLWPEQLSSLLPFHHAISP